VKASENACELGGGWMQVAIGIGLIRRGRCEGIPKQIKVQTPVGMGTGGESILRTPGVDSSSLNWPLRDCFGGMLMDRSPNEKATRRDVQRERGS